MAKIAGVSLAGHLFDRWVRYVFDHPVTDPQWHWDLENDPWGWMNDEERAAYTPATTVALLTETFARSGEVLLPYSNAQVNQGLWYLASPSCSNFIWDVKDVSVLWTDQRQCFESMFTLFEQCFAKRCSSHLSHLDEHGVDPLNMVCYMWWDILPIHGTPGEPSRADGDATLLSVMARTLYLDSDACRESALHGLGHWKWGYPQEIAAIIDAFLAHTPSLRPELKSYARNARFGHVQ